MINIAVPYLAVVVNFMEGFIMSRPILIYMDKNSLIQYCKDEAEADFDTILLIKDDQVLEEVTP